MRAHKLRSFLTLLGVVIATTTLIVVMSIVNGMNLYIADHIANLGANIFVLHQFKWAQGYEAWLKARRRNKPIRMEDYEFLEDNLQGYKKIGAMASLEPNPPARYKGHAHRRDQAERRDAQLDRHRPRESRDRADTSTTLTTSTTRVSASSARIWWKSFFPDVDPLDKEVSVGRHSLPGDRRGGESRQHVRPEPG